MPSCCVCGRDLPNKYAVAARCSEPGCEAVFCTLHAATWNHKCPAHGGSETSPLHAAEPERGPEAPSGARAADRAESAERKTDMNPTETAAARGDNENARPSRLRGVLSSVGGLAAKAGRLAGDVVRRIRHEKDPAQMLRQIDESLAANKEKHAPLLARNAALASEISAKKKAYEAAPAARRKVLELELRNLIAEYKATERELSAFFQNEHSLVVVRGRLLEQVALGMQKLKEEDVDRLADDIEDAVSESENVLGAVRDLDKAGRRRESESDADSFAADLAAFDDPAADGAVAEDAAGEDTVPGRAETATVSGEDAISSGSSASESDTETGALPERALPDA